MGSQYALFWANTLVRRYWDRISTVGVGHFRFGHYGREGDWEGKGMSTVYMIYSCLNFLDKDGIYHSPAFQPIISLQGVYYLPTPNVSPDIVPEL